MEAVTRDDVSKAIDEFLTEPHERNKQRLWSMDNAIENNNYRCLVPLHPSSLTYSVSRKLNNHRLKPVG